MALQNIRISTKLPIFAISAILLTGAILSSLILYEASDGFEEMAESKLQALATARQSELSNYLGIIESDLNVQAHNPTTISALKHFQTAWRTVKGDKVATLQKDYITDNPNPAGEKHKLDISASNSLYDKIHVKYHGYFRTLLEERGYYDIFLIDPKGNVIYSVYKELDYATNLENGKWAKTDLGVTYKQVNADPTSTKPAFTDFSPYAPSADAPASFLGRAVQDGKGKFVGTIVYQMPVGEINRIMQASEGMGESGETYIVGADLLMRSDSRFSKESTILKTKIDSATVHAALKGGKGVSIIDDYRGIPVISAFVPVQFNGVPWAIIAEVDVSEAMATATSIRNISLIFVSVISIIGAVVSLWFAKSITSPITHIVGAMTDLASGNSDVKVPYSERKDEIGDMAGAVAIFRENMVKAEQLAEEQHIEEKAKQKRAETIDHLLTVFNSESTEALSVVSSAATEMEASSQSMKQIAITTSEQATMASTATEETSASIQSVATATEELAASANEINRQITQSTEIGDEAVAQAKETNTLIMGLSDSVSQIGEVVGLITNIADQTNLLALNATIEAARAGEAGKGFSVVATEVKSLADQTSKATDEISLQIKLVQDRTGSAVHAIQRITSVITQISEVSSSIAAAMEEQEAATGEISRSVQQASVGTQEVATNVSGVTTGASETGEAAKEVMDAAGDVSRQTSELRDKVDTFLKNIRVADEKMAS